MPDGKRGLLTLPVARAPALRYTCAHTQTYPGGQPCRPLLGGGPPARWPAHPGAFRPLLPPARLPGSCSGPAQAAISSPGPGGSLLFLSVCKWPAPGTAGPLRRQGHAWPGPRVQPAGQGAFLPLPGAWHHCLLWWPWVGENDAAHWGSGVPSLGVPKVALRLQGPLGNNEGGQPLADMSPPNTSPPLEATDAPGEYRAPVCVCSAQARHSHPAAAWTRVSALSLTHNECWALEDGRPRFKSHPNPHQLVEDGEVTRPLSSVPPLAGCP